MSSSVNDVLRRLVRGSALVAVGMAVQLLGYFLARVLLARGLGVEGYGSFSLGLAVASFAVMLSLLGLHEYLPREVALAGSREEASRAVSTALASVLAIGAAVASLAAAARPLEARLFGPEAADAIAAMAASAPFQAGLQVLVAAARGLGRTRERILYIDVAVPLLWLASAAIVYLARLGAVAASVLYVLVSAAVFAAALVDYSRTGLLRISMRLFTGRLARRLLAYSAPLLVAGVTAYVMNWTDTLMLGALRGTLDTGLYNAAAPLARLAPRLLEAAAYLYLPLAATVYARGGPRALSELYAATARLVYTASLPIIAPLVLYPRQLLTAFFGEPYAAAAPALVVLVAGYMAHLAAGPNGSTLIALGDTKAVTLYTAAAAALNVALNTALIPSHGALGAAAATAASYIASNAMALAALKTRHGVSPLDRRHVALVAYSVALLAALQPVAKHLATLPAIAAVDAAYTAAIIAAALKTRIITREEITLLLGPAAPAKPPK